MYKNYKKDKELAAKALGISRATLYRKLEKYKDEINDYFNQYSLRMRKKYHYETGFFKNEKKI